MSNQEIRDFLNKNPEFLFQSKHTEVAKLFNVTAERVRGIARRMKNNMPPPQLGKITVNNSRTQVSRAFTGGDPENVLVIGDLHAPFILDGYLDFCRRTQEEYNCGTVVQIGDLTDGHSYSYHEHDPDGMSVGAEYNAAKDQLAKLFQMFPKAYCTLGNHDMLPFRKAKTAGLSKAFMKTPNDIWGAPPGWTFCTEVEINGVLYTHGTGSSGPNGAFNRAKDSRTNLVMGHTHSFSSVQYAASHKDLIWAMQIGCGIDRSAYAFEYGETFAKKPIISCGVVLNSGKLPVVLTMPLV